MIPWIEKSAVNEVGFCTESDPKINNCPDTIKNFNLKPSTGKLILANRLTHTKTSNTE